jgi:hypothetical protein
MIAQSSGLSSKDHETSSAPMPRAARATPVNPRPAAEDKTIVEARPYIGFIGVTIDYEDGLNGPSFFERNPSPIVQVTGASPWKIRAMMATGLIRNAVAHRFKADTG